MQHTRWSELLDIEIQHRYEVLHKLGKIINVGDRRVQGRKGSIEKNLNPNADN